MKLGKKLINFLIGMMILVIIWQLVIWIGGYPEALLPSPLSVGKAVIALLIQGTFFEHMQSESREIYRGLFLSGNPCHSSWDDFREITESMASI